MRLQRIGCYSVTAKIGEGGMGEVYRARDTTLDRDVAIKVLPQAFTMESLNCQYFAEPTPHIVLEPLIDPARYAALSFPELPKTPQGRIGRDLYQGESGHADVVQSPGWSEIYDKFTSLEFVKDVLAIFADDMRRDDCLVDPIDVHLDPYYETREETKRALLSKTHPPAALFTRFDFQAADITYAKGVHADLARRIVGGVFFFSDAEEENIDGGGFGLYEDELFRNDRICHRPKLVKEVPLHHNVGVLFLNSNRGFHGRTKIRSCGGLRKWVYYSISSRRDVWPFERHRSSRVKKIVRRIARGFALP